jgi:hypothetical protein
MKKLLIAAIVLFISNAGYSQINKGQWMAGGSVSFESGKTGSAENTKYTMFDLSPDAAYFFINNFAGGLRVNLSTQKYKLDEAFTRILVSPFVRYYFLPAAQKVNILADASYGFGSVKQGNNQSFNQFAVAAGPTVFLTQNTALEFLIKYSSTGGDAFGDDRANTIGLNVGFQVHLGK